jgi:hypothetical protein
MPLLWFTSPSCSSTVAGYQCFGGIYLFRSELLGLTGANIKICVFSNAILCSLVDMYRRFGETCHHSLQVKIHPFQSEDEGGRFLRILATYQPNYTVSRPSKMVKLRSFLLLFERGPVRTSAGTPAIFNVELVISSVPPYKYRNISLNYDMIPSIYVPNNCSLPFKLSVLYNMGTCIVFQYNLNK